MPAPSLRTKPSRSRSKGRLAWAGSSFRSESARMAAKPARPIRVSAASLPPVIITSASPHWIARKALPMELAALAQAVTMHSFGPRRPHWIETCPLAELAISLGMVKAETLSGPFMSSRSCWVSISVRPPMPEPIVTPQRNGSYLREVDAGVLDGVDDGHDGELREAVELLLVARLDVPGGRPIGDLAAEADAVVAGVETAQHGDAALAVDRRGSKSRSTWRPSEVTAPIPVTTTRRFMYRDCQLDEASLLCHGVLDVVDGLTDRLDLLRRVVGNVDVELLFEFHHQLDRIEAVRPQIVDERRFAGNLVLVHAKLFGNDINYTFFD